MVLGIIPEYKLFGIPRLGDVRVCVGGIIYTAQKSSHAEGQDSVLEPAT